MTIDFRQLRENMVEQQVRPWEVVDMRVLEALNAIPREDFVPESQRASLQQGARFSVRIDGVAQTFNATLNRIRSEASFTPYYALSGDDASRLTYRADLFLDGDAARKLPAGVPCQATLLK